MARSPEDMARRNDERAAAIFSGSLRTQMGDRTAACPTHGEYVSTGFRVNVGAGREIWSRCPACESALKAQEEAERLAEQRARQQREHERMLGFAQIPSRFVGRSFENFRVDGPPQLHALTVCRDFAEQFDENAKRGKGLILSGMPGTGKSHLAAAILQALIHRNVQYLTCMDMIRRVRDTWRKTSDQSEVEVLDLLSSLDLLVIDEIGVQYGTDGEQTIIFDVLDRRYRDMRPTVLLTNQDKAGLKTFIGERSFDRLTETCRWVPFDWASFRPQARKEAA
jgi:DNA replication protein DnaC